MSPLLPQTVIIKSEVVKQAASIFFFGARPPATHGDCSEFFFLFFFPATQKTRNSLERIHGNSACAAISDVKTSFLVNMKLFGVCFFN